MSIGIVSYYTVKFGSDSETEFEKFEQLDFPDHEDEYDQLLSTFEKINFRGVKLFYFKPEGPAFYLPNVDEDTKNEHSKDYGIRLYCAIPLENTVILLNGGIKTTWKPQDCPNVRDHCDKAIKLAIKLNKAIQSGDLRSESDLLDLEISI